MANDRNVLTLASSGNPDKLAKAVSELRDLLPARIEYQKMIAKLQREAFLAYVAEGFTPEQAIELCRELKP